MKIILFGMIFITNLLSHSLILEDKEKKDLKNCFFNYKEFHSSIELKEKIYKDNKEYKIIGLGYEECKDRKNEFKNIFKFYAMIEIKNTKKIEIKNGNYKEIHNKIIERYKIDMNEYLNIENKVDLIRKKELN